MSNEMISLIPKIIEKYKIKTLDITGGAPELHPEFKNLITSLGTKQVDIIDRCNLTIFFEEGYEDLPQFLAKNKVIVTASLPCYEKNNVDFQRGFGVFEKSINAIKFLNDLGYGKKENGLQLNLVYNPVSPILPPSQEILEKDYKKILFEKYNIVFNNLYTITNMPINRYEESLRKEGKLETYYKLLKENFNEKNLENLMCKKTISVNWLGEIYDCDFNQQINFREDKGPKTLFDLLNKFPSYTDFGKDIIPEALNRGDTLKSYVFDDYWEDIGTIGAFFESNLALTEQPKPPFSFYDEKFPIYTRPRFLPPSKLVDAQITDSIVCEGTILKSCSILHCVLGVRSRIESDSVLEDTLVMGADFFESPEERIELRKGGGTPLGVGEGTTVKRAILDKNTRIGDNVVIINKDRVEEADKPELGFYIRNGIVVVVKNATIANGTVI